MRRLWLSLALAACSHGSHGPAWPAPSTTGDDGGESIAPHESSKVATATDTAEPEEAKPNAPAATVPAQKSATDAATPAVAPAAPPTVEDIFINEEITIEIDD